MNINTHATLSTTINVHTNVIDVRVARQLIIHFEPRFPSSIHLNFMKTACRYSTEQKERQQTDRDRDTRFSTAIYIHIYIYIQLCSSDFCGRVSQSGIWKKREKERKGKKKERKDKY